MDVGATDDPEVLAFAASEEALLRHEQRHLGIGRGDGARVLERLFVPGSSEDLVDLHG